MKKPYKVAIAALSAILIILFFPIPEQPYKKLDDSALLEYKRVGGVAGFFDTLTIYENRSAELKRGPVTPQITTYSISETQLQILKDFINQKRYSANTFFLFGKLIEPTCCDMLSQTLLINDNGNTVSANFDKSITDIIISIVNSKR